MSHQIMTWYLKISELLKAVSVGNSENVATRTLLLSFYYYLYFCFCWLLLNAKLNRNLKMSPCQGEKERAGEG